MILETVAAPPRPPSLATRRMVGFGVALTLLIVVLVASLAVGSRTIAPSTVLGALTGADHGPEAVIVTGLRLPRTVMGVLVGCALGAAGALAQAVTRNPLADPGILGVNSGASFAVAIAVAILGVSSPAGYIWFAFAGALVAMVAVYLIGAGGAGPASPGRVTLAGVAIGAVLSGITSAMVLANPRGYNAMRAWQAGSLANRGWQPVAAAAPFVVAGLILAVALGKALNAVVLGDDLARSLGTGLGQTRALSLVGITILAGAATAMAGPIAFVGLMIPHTARWLMGPDQRWIAAYSIVLGPVLLLAADVLGRVIMRPGELPVGVVTAFVGAPVLIYLVRRRSMGTS